jgi:hypothetical protein
MNLFNKAKERKINKSCQNCNAEFTPDNRNVKRGWGLYCSKSCAVTHRNRLAGMSKSQLTQETRDIRLNQLGIY